MNIMFAMIMTNIFNKMKVFKINMNKNEAQFLIKRRIK